MPTLLPASMQTVLNCDQSEKPAMKSLRSIRPAFNPLVLRSLSNTAPAALAPGPASTRTSVLSLPKNVTVCPPRRIPSDVEYTISPIDEPIAGFGDVSSRVTVFDSPAFNATVEPENPVN